jgi:hypothetical protein
LRNIAYSSFKNFKTTLKSWFEGFLSIWAFWQRAPKCPKIT